MCCGDREWTDAYLGGVALVNVGVNFGDIYARNRGYQGRGLQQRRGRGQGHNRRVRPAAARAAVPLAPHFGPEVGQHATRSTTATLPAGPISANLSTPSLSLLGGLDADWTAPSHQHAGLRQPDGQPRHGFRAGRAGAGQRRGQRIGGTVKRNHARDSPPAHDVCRCGRWRPGRLRRGRIGPGPRRTWRRLRAQLGSGQPYALRLDGAAVTVVGTLTPARWTWRWPAVPLLTGVGRGIVAGFGPAAPDSPGRRRRDSQTRPAAA